MKSRPAPLAKLSRPRLFDAVPRERLFERIDTNRQRPVVWIAGQPGSGKTTLVASYLASRKLGGLWYQADSADADPASFFYFAREASRQRPVRGTANPEPPLLGSEHLQDLPLFSRLFFRALFQRLHAPAVIVIDNYQEIPESSPLHGALAAAMEEVPEGISVLFLSWSAPPPAYARLLAHGGMANIGWLDLRLTLDEAQAIANSIRAMDTATVKGFHERTDGWAAGLRLAVEQDASIEQIRVERGAVLFDYFASQVLAHLPDLQGQTLVATALLNDMTPGLATEATGDGAAGAMLEDLHRRHLFIDRVGDDPPRYRFHTLFRGFLLRILAETTEPEALRLLRHRSADALARHGKSEDAFDLYVAADASRSAAAVIHQLAPALLSQGRWATVLDLMARTRLADAARPPWFDYWGGLAYMNRDFGEARKLLERAYVAFDADGDVIGAVSSVAAILSAYYFEYGNFAPMDPWIAIIDPLLDGDLAWPDASTELFVHGAVLLACVFRQPGHRLLPFSASRVAALLDREPDVNRRLSAGIGLMHYHTLALEMPKARAVIARVSPFLDSSDLTALNRANWHVFAGYYFHRAAEHDRSLAEVGQALAIAREGGLGFMEFFARIFAAYMHCSWLETEAAEQAIDGLDANLDSLLPMGRAQYHLAVCCNRMTLADSATAARHARLGLAAVQTVDSPVLGVLWRLIGAAALAMDGEVHEARGWVDEATAMCSGNYMVCYCPSADLVRAFIDLLAGNQAAAREHLARALSSGRANDTFWYFRLLCSPVTATTLPFALENGIESALAHRLIERFAIPAERPWLETWPWQVKVRTLGTFEVEIAGKPAQYAAKVPRKTLLLLKALISLGGRDVPDHRLIDALWPQDDADTAADALSVALYRLRKLLGDVGSVTTRDGRLTLNPTICWSDSTSFEHYADAAQAEMERGAGPMFVDAARRCLELYRGEFLSGEATAPWAIPHRERLRSKYLRLVRQYGEQLERDGLPDDAMNVYLRGLNADDLAESLYQGVMRCHLTLGRPAEALSVYRRMRQTLSVVLGIAPGAESEAIYQSLTQATGG